MLALNALGAVVAVHSNAQGAAPDMDLGAAMLGAPFNTTRAIVNMSYLQTFTLYPNITWLFVDAGGTLPYLAYRSSLFLVYPVLAQNLGLDFGDLDEGNIRLATSTSTPPGRPTRSLPSPGDLVSTAIKA